MELVLTGRRVSAAEADRLGFVTRIVPAAETLSAALDLAAVVAAQPAAAVRAAVAAVRAAFEGPLADGVRVERDLFRALFGTPDQAEGMRAFAERREPRWRRAGAIANPSDGAS
jgi:enoyl-CoA hydratase